MSAEQLTVVVTGGSGPSGIAAARALRRAGHRVFTVGSDGPRIEAAAAEAGDGVTPLVCDLAVLADVRALHAGISAAAGRVDGVIHLVGGWRGAKGITDQSDEDWDFLERSAITTVRNVTRVFYDDLASSSAGRFAMVTSTAAATPTASGASYVAAKAAAEAWTLAVAEGFTEAPASAAVIFVVKGLVDAGMRAKSPGRSFAGFTDVDELAAAAVGLFTAPAAELNGRRLLLSP
ncbi:SDR family NAD(P)-dependent oxidoreductase [Arthrobacter sp. ISL-72]|uniref:SDR family NAD(P)-dependent oxidoreductase n=1 Tax=Arthrobacter sp. ISL-72 TaxID=2819114 RepID=UPI001BE8D4F9|nr:SDR family NAD(P)-dependent oxidoreductase [Arthrobacter sp. ISL-72]MBT2596914.1 SDR family NAD(P)-dependent oxidoreductase [Arthrobacter sp. ISL-72]